MEPTQTKNVVKRSKHSTAEEVEDKVEHVEGALRERVEQARDLVEDLRDRAEMAFHERPYLLPVATGALGFGVGVLVGSKLSRIILLTAAGALLSDTLRVQVAKISRDFIKDLGAKLEDEDDGSESAEAV
jgi:hypothetical protein